MSAIKIIDSNFLEPKTELSFNDGQLKGTNGSIPVSDIRSINYEKPTREFEKGAHRMGVLAPIKNLFSAGKSLSKSENLNFEVYLKNGKFFAGRSKQETYFKIHNAWIEAKSTK